MTQTPKPTAAYIGTRWEALEALGVQCDVTKILCLHDSRVHRLATKAELPLLVFQRGDREKAMSQLRSLDVDLVLSAGFPWIINPSVLNTMPSIKLNSHPSLLPRFPGKDAIRDALKAGATHLGVTVHEITSEVDGGPIIDQESLDIANIGLANMYRNIFDVIEPLVVGRALQKVLHKHGCR